MDVGSVLSMAGALQSQRLDQARLEANLHQVKDFQDLQANIVAQLLASMPSVSPDGVGGVVDITV
jgi:hypothetical protein